MRGVALVPARVAEPRTERNRRLFLRAQALDARIEELASPIDAAKADAGYREMAHEKYRFEQARQAYPEARLMRIAPILKQLRAGNYSRYGTGLKDSIRIDSDELGMLTKREQEILRLVCMGMSNRQVADELLISEHTVKLHVSKVLRKLNLSNRTQMAVYGMQALR